GWPRATRIGRRAILARTRADHGAALVLHVDDDDAADRARQVVVQAGLDRLAVGLAEHQLDGLLIGFYAEEAGDQPDHNARQHDQYDSFGGPEAAGDRVPGALLALADDIFDVGRPARAERTTTAASVAAAPRAAAIIVARHRSPPERCP